MLIVTTNGIPGYRIEAVLGQVMGMTARSANFGANLAAGFRSLGGGELPDLTKVVYESRNEVLSRTWSECVRRGGNAIVGLRFDTGELGKNLTEVCAYGTAVVVTPIPEGEPGATPQSIARAAAENPGPGNWPRMEQGAAPADTPDLGGGQRPQVGQRPDDHQQDWPRAQAAPPGYSPAEHQRREAGAQPEARETTTPGVDDAPTNPTPPGQDQGAQRRPARPEEQRPNSGDSWLDLG